MLRSFRNIARLFRVARTLARHDALFPLDDLDVAPGIVAIARLLAGRGGANEDGTKQRKGQRLAKALNEAGPSFIKMGQGLATRSDILGDEMAADLSQLQDRLPAFPTHEAKAIIEAELGKPLEALFSEFDDTPVAAASIAQVHFAITTEGKEVAVKVLRPGIEDAFRRDLDLIRWVAGLIEAAKPEFRRLKPLKSVETLAESVELEMDLRFEAAAAGEIGENFADDEDFQVPIVDWQRTAKRVLTTQRLSGIPLDEPDAIAAAGHDPEKILEKSARASFRQVFRDGFFHADVHPGNLFVMESGAIGAVDFGIMGRLDLKTRRWLGEMLLAFLNRDYRRAAEIHFEAGWIPQDRSVDSFTQACRSIAEPILDKPQNELSIARLLGQLFQITETFQMETQPQLLLLQKTMLVAEGTGRKLAPEANMWILARPLIEEWMWDNLGPEARIRDTLASLVDAAGRLPRVLDNIEEGAAMLSGGTLKLHPETIEALKGERRGGVRFPPLWVFVAVLGLVAAVVLT
ncbi:MAG: 2-polyprenylphenol 6-hydroxylase [Proteobacteria bacterium]|nr:2-polyprenylphenol 6-hydroxylase [Pseudomonadota bacterium]MDA1022010.1 2-polyprenylphenol 6-hydroxylase [Pseudomonadota bacterium]